MEFMQGPGTSPFPPTGIYYRLAHKCLVPRFFAYGSEWSVGQIKGRPFNVQAKGQLWPTRAFYAECAQVRAGKLSRNADYKLRRQPPPQASAAKLLSNLRTLRPKGPVKLKNLFNKITQKELCRNGCHFCTVLFYFIIYLLKSMERICFLRGSTE